jgi:hypothetical protein
VIAVWTGDTRDTKPEADLSTVPEQQRSGESP